RSFVSADYAASSRECTSCSRVGRQPPPSHRYPHPASLQKCQRSNTKGSGTRSTSRHTDRLFGAFSRDRPALRAAPVAHTTAVDPYSQGETPAVQRPHQSVGRFGDWSRHTAVHAASHDIVTLGLPE